MIFLLDPDPRLDKVLTVCLRQEAKQVTRCRARVQAVETLGLRPSRSDQARVSRDCLAQAVDNYNLVARECTPAVFQATDLPPALKP